MSISLSAVGLTKAFVDGRKIVEVLRGVDLEVEPGELVGIVGPSGSGKSTLLHLLGALDRPDAGSLRIGDSELGDLSATDLAEFRNRNLGFVFQFHQLLPDFTALENVMIPGRIAGRSTARTEERARELMEEVGLSHRLDHFPSALSGGEQQRVSICRALSLDPPMLLADEPTGNLDPATAERVLDLMMTLHSRYRMSAVVVTHNPAVAERCARLLRLEDGVLRS